MNEPQDNREELSAQEGELFQYDMPQKKQKAKKAGTLLRNSLLRKMMPILILLVAAAVLLSAYFVLRSISPEDNGEDDINMIKVVDLNVTDVKTVKVKNENDAYTMYKKSGSVYKIEGYEDKPISEDVILASIEYLSAIESSKKIMVANKKLKDYGLEKPAATVTITLASGEVVLHLGNQNAGGDYFFMLEGDAQSSEEKTAVYLMDEVQANVCTADRFYYYDGNLSRFDPSTDKSNITRISVGGKKGTAINVYMTDDELNLAYMLSDPINMPFSTNVMDGILGLLGTLGGATPVGDDLSEANLEKLGLKDPSYILTWENNTDVRSVSFGNEVDGNIYCMTEDMKAIYQIPATSVTMLRTDVADMCSSITYTRDVDTIEDIVVTSGKKAYNIETQGTGENRVVKINDKTVESSIFSEFYATLLGIEVQRQGEKPAGKEPYLKLEITLKDGGKETLFYYEVDERYCFYEMNGKGMFYVKTQDVDNILINVQKVYDNEEIQVVW